MAKLKDKRFAQLEKDDFEKFTRRADMDGLCTEVKVTSASSFVAILNHNGVTCQVSVTYHGFAATLVVYLWLSF